MTIYKLIYRENEDKGGVFNHLNRETGNWALERLDFFVEEYDLKTIYL